MKRYTFPVLLSAVYVLCNAAPTVVLPLEEQGEFFEGDMNLTPSQIRDIFVNRNAGLLNTDYRWTPDSVGFVPVPFLIRPGTPYAQAQHSTIRLAMNEIERNTCLRFIPRTNQRDYIEIFSGTGCWSHVGRNGGPQELSLAHSASGTCVTTGIVMHELIHALGFYHMQSSPNRDNFVRINYENIQSGMEHNFLRYDSNVVGLFSTNYDMESIMHYSRLAFSRNGRDTITTLNPNNQNRIGQRLRMSQGDIARIRNMYNCRFSKLNLKNAHNVWKLIQTTSYSQTAVSEFYQTIHMSNQFPQANKKASKHVDVQNADKINALVSTKSAANEKKKT